MVIAAAPSRARAESLDVLRGVAVLAIFAMNVQAFAQIPQAYDNPSLASPFGPADQAMWRAGAAVFTEKFI
ncbi:MAG: hypothetical protein MI723_16350, partial [Caulobacterales bacterium]|nr:hypothetical protein [Caulobacterales bacterium]